MNSELLAVAEYMERERGIDRETLLSAVESALLSASKKSISQAQDIRISIDRKTCDVHAYSQLTVVETVKLPHDQISLAAAKIINPNAILANC